MAMTPESILGLGRKFMESRILLTAAELDLFTLLARGPLTASEVAQRLGLTPRGVEILLDALVALQLLRKQEGRHSCPPEVAAVLSTDSPRCMRPMLLLSVGGWRRWSELTEIVRRGATNTRPAVYDADSGEQATFVNAMHVLARRAAPAIVAAVDAGNARRLLDIGGALGAYTEAFLESAPELCATLFDLPPVIALARERFGDTELARRVTFAAGDFYRDELPPDHDLALLSAIIHQNSREQNVELYRKVQRALRPGGRLVIRDHVMSADHTEPASGALFAVNMLVVTAGGATYSFDEIRADLAQAGFDRVALLQSGDRMDGLVQAFRP